MVSINFAKSLVTDRFLRPCTGKERSMEKSQLRFPCVIGDGNGKETGVLVIYMDEINAFVRRKGGEAAALPPQQIL